MSEIFDMPEDTEMTTNQRRVIHHAAEANGRGIGAELQYPPTGTSPEAKKPEMVNHPAHYNQYQGLEIIDLVEQMNFNKGSAVKYVARAGFKNPDTEVQDLEKAIWYLTREIDRIQNRP